MTNTKGLDSSVDPVARLSTPVQVARRVSRQRRELAEFLIGLSEIDPAALVSKGGPGDLANLCNDLMRFGLKTATLDDRKLTLDALVDQVKANPPRTLRPLITKVRALLDAIADGQQMPLSIPAGARVWFDGQSLKRFEEPVEMTTAVLVRAGAQPSNEEIGAALKPRLVESPYPGALAWRVGAGSSATFSLMLKPGAPLRQKWSVFLFEAMRQLDSQEGIMIRRCARDRCGRIFLASRPKQVNCTRRCTNAANFERYRDKHDDYRKEHNEIAKKSYHARKKARNPRV